ncbi:Ig-like domain-containing protein, partial [Arthrospira platensis SPKY2]
RSDAQTEINYEVLATLYNLDIVELKAMTILVDSFPSDMYDIYAVLCDVDAIQIIDSVFETDDQKLGNALSWNFWLHHWQFLFVSMFGNMVAFGKPKKEVTSVTITGTATISTDNGTTQLTATVAPTDASVKDVYWTSSDITKAKVSSTGLVTAIANGTVTITATAKDGSGKTATQTITITNQV